MLTKTTDPAAPGMRPVRARIFSERARGRVRAGVEDPCEPELPEIHHGSLWVEAA
jgi:hypothetical protein